MFPEHVDHPSKLGLAPFVDIDSEEEEENDDMLIEEEYEGEYMLETEWNRDNPNLNAGAVYKNMYELRNPLTIYCIWSNNVYGTEKNEKGKLMVHCPDPRCSWKLHATGMRGKKTIHMRYNNNPHTCPAKVETRKSKLATKYWLAERAISTLRRREHDFVALATGSNRGVAALPDTCVPEITPIPAKNQARNKQAKKVLQPMSVPTNNTRSKVVAPSSNTRSERRV
ncbi:hypothetical protein D1007_43781 [Hordeum vulgare]|nr:hypothetical protein D1007_43781 [Hordeum vulgare]